MNNTNTYPLNPLSPAELEETADRLSGHIIRMTTAAGSGHPSSSLSAIDLMTALYFGGVLRHDPQRPDWPERDRFILSKGHAAPALYAVLAEAGYFPKQALTTLRRLGSPLEGHPNMLRLAGVEASTGSLGQGLSVGIGHTLAGRLDGRSYRVYVLIGDGEADEGQIWEGVMGAAKYELSNLTVIVDFNRFQQTGAVEDVMPSLTPIAEKFRAFGWAVEEIDGHSIVAILAALERAQAVTDRPQCLVARTKKGRGLSPFEADKVNRKHGKPLDEAEQERALAELGVKELIANS